MSRVGHVEDIEDRRGEPPVKPQNPPTPITQQVAKMEVDLARARQERDNLLPEFKAAMERLRTDTHNLVRNPKELEVLEQRIIARLGEIVVERIGGIQSQLKGVVSILQRIDAMLKLDQKRKIALDNMRDFVLMQDNPGHEKSGEGSRPKAAAKPRAPNVESRK